MFGELDVVVLTKALPGTLAPVGSVGTIVLVLDTEKQANEVEFFDTSHKTIDVCTVVGNENLELKTAYRDAK